MATHIPERIVSEITNWPENLPVSAKSLLHLGTRAAVDQALSRLSRAQPTVKGSEVLLGANREEGFGHLVAFGLGGIYAEALKDVHFALAPLSPEEADSLIHSLRALKLIQGARGEPGMNFTVLQDLLLRLSLLVHHFPQIKEMDLNPLKGYGQDLYVVDARIIVE